MFDILNNPIVKWLNDYGSQGVLVTDADLVIRGWNKWLKRHSGREAASLIGASLFESFPEISARGLDSLYRDALSGHAHVFAQRFHHYLIDLPTELSASCERMQQTAWISPLTDNGIVGTVTIIEDVSERVARESELSAAREEAEKANRAKDALLATLSHDLRTPLSSVLGWARIIRSGPLPADLMTRAVNSIENSAMVQVQLIDQILDMSRVSTGKLELDIDDTDLTAVIEAAIDAMTPIAESKDIRFEKQIPRETHTYLLDSKRIHQVVWNLLSNAVKFTPPRGAVQVSLRFFPGHAQLLVADTGVGITPENLKNVFKPLWQAESAGGHGGLGLGLTIAKQLVELHGGSIAVESAGLGRGTAFTVDLPRVSESEQAPPELGVRHV